MTERDYLKKLGIRIVILSRSRWKSIQDDTLKLLPDWIEIIVPVSEEEEYARVCDNPLILVPDEIEGLGPLRNWVLDNIEEETVIMFDDDVTTCYNLSGPKSKRITDKEELLQILINTAVMAKDAGTHWFGFNQTDIRKYNGTDPFNLTTWVGCVVGVIGRKYRFRNDKFKVDIDMTLQNLLVDRKIWNDQRYKFAQARDTNIGGSSKYRTEESFKQSVDNLVEKWSPFLTSSDTRYKNQVRISMNVPRRQPISYD